MLRLGANQTLVIDSPGLTLRGLKNGQSYGEGTAAQDNNTAVVYVNNANLELRDGVISGNTSSSSYYGGGVSVYSNGTFAMSGGEISGNTSSGYSGGGVDGSGGTFTMSGGEISGNTSGGNGGGVFVYSGTFAMSGGEISGNTSGSHFYGGGVCVTSGSTFTKTGGGVIYGYDSSDASNTLWNKASYGNTYGHAVYYSPGSSVYYYRDTTLEAGDDISTGSLPPTAEASYDATNWIKK